MPLSADTQPPEFGAQTELIAVPFELETVDPTTHAEHGEVFTRRWVVEMILDLVGFTPDRDLAMMTAVEPSCGTGAFLVPMVERIVESASLRDRSLTEAHNAIDAWDLLPGNVDRARAAVRSVLAGRGVPVSLAGALSESWVRNADFLLEPPQPGTVDFVVGNPPYVRLEAVNPARSAAYRQTCTTMGGRSDIYVGFYEKGLLALKPGGSLGFICADRWMRNAYGARLRELVSTGWSVDAIVHMTGVDAFENDVDAYPAVTVIRRQPQVTGPLVADAGPGFDQKGGERLANLARTGRVGSRPDARSTVTSSGFSATRLSGWFSGKDGWPNASPERLKLIADLEEQFPSLEDPRTGTRVGIGLATGADKVFITETAPGVEKERLLQLAMAKDISTGKVEWSGRFLVNPWDENGLVDLSEWPGLHEYLAPHEELLRARHTARSGKWHKTIDRVVEGLVSGTKLYIPDFKDAIFPVLDGGGTYPHHNLYWVTSDRWDLRVLGGLLLSDVANLFIEAYSVRMRGGYLRFQAQYLRRIRLPELDNVDVESATSLASAFEKRDRQAATEVALRLFGLEHLPA